jgi:low temperature requirement protein LtrA
MAQHYTNPVPTTLRHGSKLRWVAVRVAYPCLLFALGIIGHAACSHWVLADGVESHTKWFLSLVVICLFLIGFMVLQLMFDVMELRVSVGIKIANIEREDARANLFQKGHKCC